MIWEDIKSRAETILSQSWVRWIHDGTLPAKTSEQKERNLFIGMATNHCAVCLNLNGCCFVKKIAPNAPLHSNCHCRVVEIPIVEPAAECSVKKFSEYLFDESKSGGKKDLFASWGYGIIDSEDLAQEFIKQAKLAYLSGEYILGRLDAYGQHIDIVIELQRKDSTEIVSFVSGSMVYLDGKIVLTTPYGGGNYEIA